MNVPTVSWSERLVSSRRARSSEPIDWRLRHGAIFVLLSIVCVWFPFQDFVLAFLYDHGAPRSAIRALLVLKELIVLLVLAGAVVRWTQGTSLRLAGADLAGLLYATLLTVYLPVGEAETTARLAQYRSLILPFFLYLAGRSLPPTPGALALWIRLTLALAVLHSCFGIVERLLIPTDLLWRKLVPIGVYLEDIKAQGEHLVYGLPGNMYGDYGFGYFQFRRLCGVFGSPLTLGYYLVFPIVLLICTWLDERTPRRGSLGSFAPILLCGLALLMTVTRVGIGSVLISVALALLLYRQVRLIVVALLFCTGIFVAFEDVIFKMLYNMWILNDSSTRGHYEFLLESLKVVFQSPLGLGIGMAGGWAHTMSNRFSGAAENAYLVIAAQAGVHALTLFLGFCLAALAALRRVELRTPAGPLLSFYRAVAISIVAYLATGVLSEQILTFTSVAHFWISVGYAVTLAQHSAEWSEADAAAAGPEPAEAEES